MLKACVIILCVLDCRRAWDDISGKIGASFKVSEYAVKQSEEVVRRAKSLHDILIGKKRESDGNWCSSANKKVFITLYIFLGHGNPFLFRLIVAMPKGGSGDTTKRATKNCD